MFPSHFGPQSFKRGVKNIFLGLYNVGYYATLPAFAIRIMTTHQAEKRKEWRYFNNLLYTYLKQTNTLHYNYTKIPQHSIKNTEIYLVNYSQFK